MNKSTKYKFKCHKCGHEGILEGDAFILIYIPNCVFNGYYCVKCWAKHLSEVTPKLEIIPIETNES